jgi:hypothetical protein
MKSLYETFGNEINFEIRKDKIVQFLKNNTVNFPLPEASVEILANMLGQENDGINTDTYNIVYNRLTDIGFNKTTAKTLAVALIKISKQQGVHPISYFELNEESIKLAENTYRAINKIRPKGNLIGITVSQSNKKSKIAKSIRP